MVSKLRTVASRLLSWRGRAVGVLPTTAGLLGLWAVAFAGSAVAAGTTVAFTTQGCTTWTVPTGISSVQIQATGAAGSGPGAGPADWAMGCREPCRV